MLTVTESRVLTVTPRGQSADRYTTRQVEICATTGAPQGGSSSGNSTSATPERAQHALRTAPRGSIARGRPRSVCRTSNAMKVLGSIPSGGYSQAVAMSLHLHDTALETVMGLVRGLLGCVSAAILSHLPLYWFILEATEQTSVPLWFQGRSKWRFTEKCAVAFRAQRSDIRTCILYLRFRPCGWHFI